MATTKPVTADDLRKSIAKMSPEEQIATVREAREAANEERKAAHARAASLTALLFELESADQPAQHAGGARFTIAKVQ